MAREMPSWFPFLKIEADIAMTFIDCARYASNPESADRYRGHARKALAQIQKGLAKPEYHGLSEDEVVFLEQRSVEIELAMAEV